MNDYMELTTDMFDPASIIHSWLYEPTIEKNLSLALPLEPSLLFRMKKLNIEFIKLKLKTEKDLFVITMPKYDFILDKNQYRWLPTVQSVLDSYDCIMLFLRERINDEWIYDNHIITDNKDFLFQLKLSL